MFFPGRENQAVDAEACGFEIVFQTLTIEGVDVGISNDGQGLRLRQAADIIASPVEEAIFNMNIIRIFS